MEETIHYANPPEATDTEAIREMEEKLAPLKTANPQKKLGVALVGLGNYSTNQLAPALMKTEQCYLAGLVTGTDSKIPKWKNKYGLPDTHIYNYEDIEKISENRDIDVLYIALPNALHAEYVVRAARAGKHVICEKPMAISVEECDRMIAACREAGKLLSIGYRLYFDPSHAELIKLGQGKVYGELKYIHAAHGSDEVKGWRLDAKLAGGGSLMDLGIYCIRAACYASGLDPVSVKAVANESRSDMKETLRWEMEFPNGLIAHCECSYSEKLNNLHVDAEHGWVELSPAYLYEGITGKTATGFMSFPPVNQQALQMDSFALSIMQGTPVVVPGEMGRSDLVLIEAIYESLRSGKKITLAKEAIHSAG